MIQQRLHDQLNALAPGLSAPAGHGRAWPSRRPTGQAVLACAAAFAGRAPTVRSLQARAPGRLTDADARYWADAVARLPATAARRRPARRAAGPRPGPVPGPAGRHRRAGDPTRSAAGGHRWTGADHACPASPSVRASAFAALSLPISRFPDAEHLYSATGLAPALYESATIKRRGRISRQGLAEHRDALMGIAWGLSQYSPSFSPTRRRVPRPRHDRDPGPRRPGPARLPAGLPDAADPNNPSMSRRTVEEGTVADGDGHVRYAARRRNLACRPSALGRPCTAHTKACRPDRD